MSISSKRLVLDSECSIRHAYSPRRSVGISFDPDLAMTEQSHKDECDINVIMSRYQVSGILPQTVQLLEGQFADVSEIDFQSAANLVAAAKSMFMELPSSVRSRFSNDPAAFLAFTNDPNNRPAMAEMGLLSVEATQAILNPQPASKNASEGVSGVSSAVASESA